MNFEAFRQSLSSTKPPAELSVQLCSLWYDAKGNWSHAHDLVNDLTDPVSAHIHAYLHRKEGDEWNAGYWYNRAGKKKFTGSLEEEWENLVKTYLA